MSGNIEGNKKKHQQYGDDHRDRIEIFKNENSDLLAEHVHDVADGKETHGARQNGSGNENRKVNAEKSRRDGEYFIRDRGKSGHKDRQERIVLKKISDTRDILLQAVQLDQKLSGGVKEKKADRVSERAAQHRPYRGEKRVIDPSFGPVEYQDRDQYDVRRNRKERGFGEREE